MELSRLSAQETMHKAARKDARKKEKAQDAEQR